jgi:hypothetical protein
MGAAGEGGELIPECIAVQTAADDEGSWVVVRLLRLRKTGSAKQEISIEAQS